MKAVIVEIRGETAAALGRDGSVFKVKNHAYAVGQTIDVRRGGFSRQLAVLAAAAAAVPFRKSRRFRLLSSRDICSPFSLSCTVSLCCRY